jgi:hypothetical protein
VISGFTTDSDVDLVAVWQTLPDRAVIQGATRVVLDDLVLEKARCVNHDLDVMHLPLSGFSSSVDAVEAGRTWRSSAWPDPLYAVAGLAHGLVVHDPSGEAARLQSRLSRPAPMFVKVVRDGVRQALPDYLRELRAATTRGDLWLHQKLLGELIRMEYVLLFAVAGHYCPFPSTCLPGSTGSASSPPSSPWTATCGARRPPRHRPRLPKTSLSPCSTLATASAVTSMARQAGVARMPTGLSRVDLEALHRLVGDLGDEVEVLVDVQHGEADNLGRRGDEQIRYGGSSVVTGLGEETLHLHGSTFRGRRKRLDRHHRDGRLLEVHDPVCS